MSNKSFVHLHVHADGSKLDGLAQIKKLVPAAEALGMPSIAITDHGSMSATYDLYKATKGSGVKPIYGIEGYLSPGVPRTHKEPVRWNEGGDDDVSGAGAYTHITMLAETNEGLHNLFKISSEAYLTGFYRQPRADEDLLQELGKGIIGTTGCPSGEVQTWLRIGDYNKARESAAKFADIFGKDNYFIELMDHGLGIEKRVIGDLLKLAKDLRLPTVATNDLHYVHQNEAHVHDALLCIGSGSKLSDPDRFRFDAQDFYLKSAEEMRRIWDDIAPDACDNTLLIAERCVANFEDGHDLMPQFPIPDNETEATWLDKEVRRGLEKRYPDGIPEDRIAQAKYEVDVINQMGFPGYFLVTADFINWAKEHGIRVGPGRGCLSADTNVLTPQGFKKITEIKVGDAVYNEKGEAIIVPEVFEYDCDEELIEIKSFYGVAGNKMTADHKVLVSKARRVTNKSKLAQGHRYEKGYDEPIWLRADEVEVGDMVVMPKLSLPTNTLEWTFNPVSLTATNLSNGHSIHAIAKKLNISRPSVSKYFATNGEAVGTTQTLIRNYTEAHNIDLEAEKNSRVVERVAKTGTLKADYDTGLFFGLFISDGWIRKDGRGVVGFAQNRSEDEGFIPDLLERLFGLEAVISDSKTRNLRQYNLNHVGIAQMVREIFPEYDFSAHSKYIPQALFETPEEFRKGLLEGLWYGDGSHKGNKSKYSTVSEKLAQNMVLLLNSLALPAGMKVAHRIDKRENFPTEHVEYTITTAHNFDTSTIIMGKGYDGNFTYLRVREINKVPAEGKVYDFTVPGTHSYVTDSYVVHNSAAGSLVAYAMGITDIDPMKHGLMFERFLNPERVSMPDIDVDFDDRRRGEVIEYVKQKYGEDKVAQIMTNGTIKGKSAIKDSVRVLGLPYMLGDKLSKLYPAPIVGRDMPLADVFDPSSERYDEAAELRAAIDAEPEAKQAVELALGLEGVKRGVGMHAAGVIMSRKPLVETIPLMKRDTKSPVMTAFEYPSCEYLGLLKMDFLGLSNLGTLDEALRLIKLNRGVEVDLDQIGRDLDDKKTFEMVAEGHTLGVFQLDSPPMRSLLKLMVPDSFEDISAVLALYRPGPMGAGSHIEYADRKNGRRPQTPIHPELAEPLDKILGDTYGLCVSGDTLIWNADSGLLVRIDSVEEEIKGGRFYTFSVNASGDVERKKVTHWFKTGVKNIYEIISSDGRMLRVSGDHPVLTLDGYKKASELDANVDLIASSGQELLHVNVNNVSNEEARLIGYLLGDGYINLYQNTLTNSSDAIIEHVSSLATGLFDDLSCSVIPRFRDGVHYTNHLWFSASPQGIGRGRGKNNVYKTTFKMNRWLSDVMGIETKTLARDKKVPDIIFGASLEAVKNFLAGLWDTDGYVGDKSAFLKTISPELASGVQMLFDKLGIHSYIYSNDKYENVEHGDTQAYGVYVYDASFWDEIVPLLVHESKKLTRKKVAARSSVDTGVNKNIMLADMGDVIISDSSSPKNSVSRIINNGGTASLKSVHGFYVRKGLPHLPTKTANREGSNFVRLNLNTKTYLDNFASEANIFNAKQRWSEIKSITICEPEEVYDITVEDNHNFYANGVVVHNCIYQEQVMKIAQELAGYSLGGADLLRRAMGKKNAEILAKEFEPFKAGMMSNGYSEEAIVALWEVLVPFSDYAFNRAHTAGYGLVSYWTAWLKANFPVEYMAALLTTNAGNKDKLALYLGECRRMGIKVLVPDVNASELNYTAVGEDIRTGLVGVKGVGDAGVNAWLEERRINGPATGFGDFLMRGDTAISGKRAVANLIVGGAFDSFGFARSALFAVHEDACEGARKAKKAKKPDVVSLFDELMPEYDVFTVDVPSIEEWDKKEKLAREREVLGLYVSDHPLADYGLALEMLTTYPIAYLRDVENPPSEVIKVTGLVSGVERKLTKKASEPWAIVTVEDLDSDMSVFVFPKTYAEVQDLLKPDAILTFSGRAERRDDGSMTFAVRDVSSPDMGAAQRKAERLHAAAEANGGEPVESKTRKKIVEPMVNAGYRDDGNTAPLVIRVDEKRLTVPVTERFKGILLEYVGSRPVHLTLIREDGTEATMELGADLRVVGTAQLAAELRALLGPDCV